MTDIYKNIIKELLDKGICKLHKKCEKEGFCLIKSSYNDCHVNRAKTLLNI